MLLRHRSVHSAKHLSITHLCARHCIWPSSLLKKNIKEKKKIDILSVLRSYGTCLGSRIPFWISFFQYGIRLHWPIHLLSPFSPHDGGLNTVPPSWVYATGEAFFSCLVHQGPWRKQLYQASPHKSSFHTTSGRNSVEEGYWQGFKASFCLPPPPMWPWASDLTLWWFPHLLNEDNSTPLLGCWGSKQS